MAAGALFQPATGDQKVDGLLGGVKWDSLNVLFNFPISASYYPANYGGVFNEPAGFAALSTNFKSIVMTGLGHFSSICNLTFTEVGASAPSNISIARTSNLPPGSGGSGYFPWFDARGGDIWFNTDLEANNLILGDGVWDTVLHEIGHATGLKHGHEIDGFGAVPSAFDFIDYTVMTYRRYENGPTTISTEWFGRPQTLMMLDIAALQTMYGANYNTQSGDTVYRWNPSTGQMSINGVMQAAPGANRIFMTVWDGNGSDTYDLSNYTTNLNIDLTPGGKSIFADAQLSIVDIDSNRKATGNVFNALLFNNDERSLIENAIGGSGNDNLTGNSAANVMRGNAGNDAVNGGAGIDSAVFSGLRLAYTLTDLGGGSVRVSGPDGTDTITKVERLVFDDQTVNWLTGAVRNDFDADGKSDILFRQNSGVLWVTEMNGLAFKAGGSPGTFANPASIAGTGDFDGDGKADILARNGNSLWVTLMDGLAYKAGASPGAFFAADIVGIADFDADGKSDILSRTGDVLFVTEMNGLAYKGGGSPGTFSNAASILGTGDFDGDGKADILARSGSSLWVTLMDGFSFKAGGSPGAVDPVSHFEGTADFDGDGKDDILWRNDAGTLWVTEMNGLAFKTGGSPGTVSNAWHVAETGDYDGDGKDDILFRHDDGTLWVTEMNGLAFKAGGSPGLVNNAWNIVGDQHDLFIV
jgi:hypothetical protein